MTKHTGINDTDAPIYLVEAVTITADRRARDGFRFSTKAESFTDRAKAGEALQEAIGAALTAGTNTEVALKIKRPGSKAFVARKPGE